MKINFTGQINEVIEGIKEVAGQLGFIISEDGTELYIEKNTDGTLKVKKDKERVSVSYCIKADFYRGLSLAVDCIKNNIESFEKTEKRAFESCGGSIDVSRNAVLRVEAVKKFIRYTALMGHNLIYLYMEDTYKIEGYEYFGYMRGAYSEEELKEIVTYADIFGMEIAPSMQVLAHLEKTLKWRCFLPITDTPDILLVDEEKTYDFIEAMFKTLARCFKSRKIIMGLDEAHGLGMGEYFKKHGLCDKFEILSRHLERVNDIAKKYGFNPIIPSDMFFRLGSKTGDYYDLDSKIPENISELIPDNIQLLYWDYYNESEEMYDALIKEHMKMQRPIVFWGGVWIWGSLAANYDKTFIQSKIALPMCRKYKIKEVIASTFGDDGAETSVFEALLGMQLFAEYNFCENPSDEQIKKMFKICTGFDMDAFLLFGLDGMLHNETIDKLDDLWNTIQVTKQLFYQDMLLGLFDKNFENENLDEIYNKTYDALTKIPSQGDMDYIFEYHKQLVKTLKGKWNIGIRLNKAYKEGDKEKLSLLAEEMCEIIDNMKLTYKLFRKVWTTDNKPFGLDVIDLRFGGVIARAESAYEQVKDYLDGVSPWIEELHEEKLYYTNRTVNHDLPMVYEWRFDHIVTAQ